MCMCKCMYVHLLGQRYIYTLCKLFPKTYYKNIISCMFEKRKWS